MSVSSPHAPLRVIAHRCLGFGHPENSEAALRAALAGDIDEVEIDFRATHDGELVASHWDLFFDQYRLPRLVSRASLLTNQARGLMSLEQCLEIFAELGAGKRLRIEVKSPGAEHAVCEAITRYAILDRVVVVSWNPKVLHTLRTISSSLELSFSYIMGLQGIWPLRFSFPRTIPAPLLDSFLRIRSVNIAPGVFSPTPDYVSELRSLGVEVFVVSRAGATNQEVERLLRLGVTGGLFSMFLSTNRHTGPATGEV
jgi:glycerophosphoryl diester phosphodiesterase